MHRSRLDKIVEQLELAAESGPDPDAAWFLEDCADAMHEAARMVAVPPLSLRPSNDVDEHAEAEAPMDRIARARGVRVAAARWLDAHRFALWVDALRTIFLCEGLSATERLLALAHELSHERLPHAPHGEIGYLGLALLCPRVRLAAIPAGRAITTLAVLQAVPWRMPIRAAEARARLLRRAEEAA